jgi:trehalose 6-phosphate synthase
METQRLTVVSNRLPVVVNRDHEGDWVITPGGGGLVTALSPLLRDRGGLWIGWLGTGTDELVDIPFVGDFLAKGEQETGFTLEAVTLTEDEVQNYYFGFSNEILWPLFHDLPSRCNFEQIYWENYRQVNRKFAHAVGARTREDDYIWVHDYHLTLVASELKQLAARRRTGFFLHIPFPPLDLLLTLPWHQEILNSMLEYDLLGFQTMRDRKNFLGCVRSLCGGARVTGRGNISKVVTPTRELLAGTFPISIDFEEFAELAASNEVSDTAWVIHSNLPKRQLILGVDRLDYTKGIPHRLQAFANALDRYPDMRGKVSLIQIVVPSREGIDEYDSLKQEIERLVGEINGRFTEVGWMPVIYMYKSMDRIRLLSYYRTCEIALVTPLKDGMNLVAKEYCTCSIDTGVLILSEFAGAAPQLQPDALLVNPHDTEGVADAIHQAFTMDYEERRTRMRRLRRSIARHDIYRWVNSFLKAAISKDLADFRQTVW